jgi:hypothetical protein
MKSGKYRCPLLWAACWTTIYAASAFTLLGQTPSDDPGVTVDAGAKLMHRPPFRYPENARPGDLIVLNVGINSKGEVADAVIASGPEELRKSILANVLQWHYDTTGGSGPISLQVSIKYGEHPADATSPSVPSGRPRPTKATGIIGDIRFVGLPAELEQRARESLPVHAGGVYSGESLNSAIIAMKKVDSHLTVSPVDSSRDSGQWVVILQISLKSQ